jgi:predicted nucleic-acid-binding protein
MLAIDTNIVVRLLTNDEHVQAARAKILFADNEVFVATTVLLETEWVLRGAYNQARGDVIAALRAFAGLATVKLEEPARVEMALTLAAGGLDFADALHLSGAEGCEAFVTFDRRFVKAAAAASSIVVREP